VPDEPVASEASVRELRQVFDELAESFRNFPGGLTAEQAMAMVLEFAEKQRGGITELATAITTHGQRPQEITVVMPESKPRKVVKETKFKADEKGQITGKTETEVEE
jgi:hypothetical protein